MYNILQQIHFIYFKLFFYYVFFDILYYKNLCFSINPEEEMLLLKPYHMLNQTK